LIFTSSNRFGPTPHTGHFSGGTVPMWMNPQTMHFHFFKGATFMNYTTEKTYPQITPISQTTEKTRNHALS